jgi:hypothetical protein
MSSTTVNENYIATLDFGPFIDGSNKPAVANAMFVSLRDTGFVSIINHDVPKHKIETMFEWVSSKQTKSILPSLGPDVSSQSLGDSFRKRRR